MVFFVILAFRIPRALVEAQGPSYACETETVAVLLTRGRKINSPFYAQMPLLSIDYRGIVLSGRLAGGKQEISR